MAFRPASDGRVGGRTSSCATTRVDVFTPTGEMGHVLGFVWSNPFLTRRGERSTMGKAAPQGVSRAEGQPVPISLAVLDDFEVIVHGVAAMLEPFADRIEVVEVDANREIQSHVDVALYDSFAQGEAHTSDVLGVLANPRVEHVAMYTWRFEPELIDLGLERGLSGYLSKVLEADELVEALERIVDGDVVVAPDPDVESTRTGSHTGGSDQASRPWPGREHGLTEREAEVVALITAGRTNDEIADLLYLSINSVKTHIRGAYRKIGVNRRPHAILWGVDHGMRFDHHRDQDPDQS